MKRKKFTGVLVAGAIAVGLVATLGLAGCGGGGASSSSSAASGSAASASASASSAQATATEGVQIFAANSLEKALPEVQALYTQQHPDVTFADTQFKASGDLVQQIAADPSQADIFIAASTGSMDDAEANIDTTTRNDMFVNDLVVVKKTDGDVAVKDLEDVADVEGKIAIGESATVPAGKYANQALASVDLYDNAEGDGGEYADSIADKVVLGDKVGTVANYVSTGDAEIGFVYTSDLYRYDGIEIAFTTPDDSHKPIVYPGAVLKNSDDATVAADFLKFCTEDPDAVKIFSNYGFELAEAEK